MHVNKMKSLVKEWYNFGHHEENILEKYILMMSSLLWLVKIMNILIG